MATNSSRPPRLSPLLADDCGDVECDLMLDALEHHLEQVEGRLNELLVESEAQKVKEKANVAKPAKDTSNNKSRQSTLPPILKTDQSERDVDVGYVVEQSETVALGRIRRRRETERLKEEEERERQKQKRVDQAKRHMALLERLEYVKEDVREDYYAALHAKISRQRRKIQERDEKLEKMRQSDIRKKQMRKKIRQPRSDGVDDWSFLHNIEQTQYYKIVSLEMELRRDGKLNSECKIQELWEAELSGKNRQLVPVKKQTANLVETRDMHRVADANDEEEETHSWAITSVPPLMMHRSERSSSRQTKSSSRSKRDTNIADDFEKRFPKVTLPPLKTLTMKLREDTPARDEWLEQQQEIMKERKRVYKKKVHMYQQSLFNQLATQQLLSRCDIFASQPELDLGDIWLPIANSPSIKSPSKTSDTSPPSHQPSPILNSTISPTTHSTSSCNDRQSTVTIESDLSSSHGSDATGSSARWDTFGFTSDTSIPSLPKLMERRRQKGHQKREDKGRRGNLESESVLEIPAHKNVAPLKMESLVESHDVILECKKPSSLWLNYLKV